MNAMRKKRGWVYRVSLVSMTALAVAVGVLWVGTYIVYVRVRLPHDPSQTQLLIDTIQGSMDVWYTDIPQPSFYIQNVKDDFELSFKFYYEMDGNSYSSWWHFDWWQEGHRWLLRFPLWPLFVVLSIWPATAAVRWIRDKPPVGLCPACGYDLRGSKGSTNCPECGCVIASSTATADAES